VRLALAMYDSAEGDARPGRELQRRDFAAGEDDSVSGWRWSLGLQDT
jgi:hypothetical protein